ncbi:MAG TPA: cupin domain-containing protein, partial [Chloroflexota bacterium]
SLMFPGTGSRVGLPTMPVGTYKKAHRHGAGIVIVIPGGEGLSVMWQESEGKKFFVWHEGSAFVPPNHWYHQHFNLGDVPGRYITMFPPRHQLFGGTRGEARFQDDPHPQIEYTEEDPAVRERFQAELRQREIENRMPADCYIDPNYKWDDGSHGGD